MKRILIVQDMKVILECFAFYIEKHPIGYEFIYAYDGKEAIEVVQSQGPFDAILMNIEMPVMGGLEATFRIRNMGYTSPIIAWTLHDKDYIWKFCEAVGMDDFLHHEIKPFPDLVQDIVAMLKKRGVMPEKVE